jgi:hypothetical protein
MTNPDPAALPAGCRARTAAVPALWASLAGAIAFTAFAYVTTQDHAVRAGSPWQDDPYDGVVSFTEFLVPALAMLIAVRALLLRRPEPQPVFRVKDAPRGARRRHRRIAGHAGVGGAARRHLGGARAPRPRRLTGETGDDHLRGRALAFGATLAVRR